MDVENAFDITARLTNLQSGKIVATTNEARLCKIDVYAEFQICRQSRTSWDPTSLILLDLAAAQREIAAAESLILSMCGNYGAVFGRFEDSQMREFGLSRRIR